MALFKPASQPSVGYPKPGPMPGYAQPPRPQYGRKSPYDLDENMAAPMAAPPGGMYPAPGTRVTAFGQPPMHQQPPIQGMMGTGQYPGPPPQMQGMMGTGQYPGQPPQMPGAPPPGGRMTGLFGPQAKAPPQPGPMLPGGNPMMMGAPQQQPRPGGPSREDLIRRMMMMRGM